MSNQVAGAVNPLRSRVSVFSLIFFYVILLGLTWVLDRGQFTQGVDQLLHDVWVRASQRSAPEDVVIVGIDPQSLEQLGRWPWPRDLQASLFAKLARSEVRAVALDLLYIEPDNYPANDALLADAIGRLPLAVLPVLTEERTPYAESAEKLPIPRITQKADNLGHIFTPLDSDGLVRRVHLKSGFRAAHWSVLGLALAEALGEAPATLPGRRIPETELFQWIEDYQVLIPFYGPGGTFTQVSVTDVLADRLPDNFLRDKIVLVGMTSTGLGDVLPTAVSAKNKPMPGVEIHANVFSALREGSLVTELGPVLNYLLASGLLLVIVLLYFQLPPFWGLLSAVGLALIPVFTSFVLYRYWHLWYAPLSASIPLVVSYLLWSWHRLDYAADFMRRETSKLVDEIAPSFANDNQRLAGFFESASELLPIDGWKFSAGDASFSGGEPVETVAGSDLRTGQWLANGQVYHKRYPTRGRLQISFKLNDSALAPQFMAYVDSLSRVKERQVQSRLSGSIERLQAHTYELKHQLDRLRQLRNLSDSIIAGSPAGLIVWNAAGEPVTRNRLADSMMPDMKLEAASLLEFLRYLGVDGEGRDQERIAALLFHAQPWQLNRVQDDTEVVVNLNATGDTLTERLISASIVDVSDIRRSERSRAELIDFLSHDLRSPLISALYLLRENSDKSDHQEPDRTTRIEGNINLTLKMIEDLLNLARADNLSSDAFTPTLFDGVVDNAVDRLAPQAHNAGIELRVETLDDDLWLDSDGALLERALVNVMSNAIKYSPAESTVTIVTRREQDHLVFSVEDQGIGIEPEMMKNLFQRFKRDVKATGKIDGIGLGLALVARVVSQHRGTVQARSPGRGTVIEICLPLNLELQDEEAAATPSAGAM